MNRAEVNELVKSIKNRCLIYENVVGRLPDYVLPTILEDIAVDAQKIVLGFCVVKESYAETETPSDRQS
jgi:hypothetical protein